MLMYFASIVENTPHMVRLVFSHQRPKVLFGFTPHSIHRNGMFIRKMYHRNQLNVGKYQGNPSYPPPMPPPPRNKALIRPY